MGSSTRTACAIIHAEANETDAARARRLQLERLASSAVSLCDGVRRADRFREGDGLGSVPAGRIDSIGLPTWPVARPTSQPAHWRVVPATRSYHCSGPSSQRSHHHPVPHATEFADRAGRQVTLHDGRILDDGVASGKNSLLNAMSLLP